MPTFKHIPSGKKIFFIHIPRTAGRFIESNLVKNNNFIWEDDIPSHIHHEGAATLFYNSPWYDAEINGFQLVHLHREIYEKYISELIPHIAIVRNPISKFISGSFLVKRYYGDKIEMLQQFIPTNITKEKWFLEDFNFCNWHRPQVDFLTKKTHLWKFEDGMGDNFFEWLGEIVGIDLCYSDHVPYHKDDDESNKMILTQTMEENILDFYKKDLKMYNSVSNI